MKTVFCPQCEETIKADLIQKEEAFAVKGDKVSVLSSVLVCPKCKNEIFDEDLDEANLQAAYNEYRKKRDLLLPSKIKEIREKYGLSQRALGRLLEWGEITMNRYESGEIQDAAHNEVLELIEDPQNMKVLFEKNMHFLPPTTREQLKQRIDNLMSKSNEEKLFIDLEQLLRSQNVDEYSGYKPFDLEKTNQMIIYLLRSLKGVYKTAINKYLWYMDFLYFKESAVSISGANYRRLPFGPAPNHYDFILDLMLPKAIDKEEVIFSNNIVGEKYTAKMEADLSSFTKDELKAMDYVINFFKRFSAKRLSEYSHREKAYLKTKDGERISYELSKELSLNLKD